MGRVGGMSFTGWAAFTERIEDPREYETEHEVEWAVGAILLVDATCYRALGGMDESYFLYSEETDFSLRAERRRVGHDLHAGRRSDARRRRIRRERDHPHDEDPQPRPTLSSAARRPYSHRSTSG